MKYNEIPTGKKVAAILARVSRDTQETESQISDLIRDAERDGYVVPDDLIFQEKVTGMDSFDKDERKSLQDLKNELLQHADIKVVYMWELTRLSRNPYYLIDQLRWFNTHHIAIYFHAMYRWTRDPITDVEDAVTTNIIFGAATYGQIEWKAIKERTIRGRDNKARKGLYVGHISDGYKVVMDNGEKKFAIDEERAEVIRRIFDLYVNQGMSTNQIAGVLNAEGILTFNALEAKKHVNDPKFSQVYKKRGTSLQLEKSQSKWLSSTVAQILKNRWYIGERTYKDAVYPVPPIIDPDTFNKAEEMLKVNRTNCTKKTAAFYPLKSLLVCGKCGNFLYGHRMRIYSTYYCSSTQTGHRCGWDGIAKQNIEGIVWNLIAGNAVTAYARNENLDDLKAALGYNLLDIKKLNTEIDNLSAKVDNQKKLVQKLGNAIAESAMERKMVEGDLKQYYANVEQQARKNYTAAKNEIKILEKELETKKILLDNANNIDVAIVEQLGNITETKDIESAGRIIKMYVKSVTLYNVAKYTKMIAVELHSGLCRYVLYDARKFHAKYYVLPFSKVRYDIENGIFNVDQCTFPRKAREIYLDGKSEMDVMAELGLSYHEYLALVQGDFQSSELTRIMKKICMANNLSYLREQFNIDDLLSWLAVDGTLIDIPKLEEEPDNEIYKKWREQTRAWYKKRQAIKSEQAKRRRANTAQQFAGYYTRMQIVQELGLTKIKVWRDIYTKKLPAEKVNGIWMVAPDDYAEYKAKVLKCEVAYKDTSTTIETQENLKKQAG